MPVFSGARCVEVSLEKNRGRIQMTSAKVEMYKVIFHAVQNLRIKYIREVLSFMRHPDVQPNTFLPKFGMTFGMFATAYVLKR